MLLCPNYWKCISVNQDFNVIAAIVQLVAVSVAIKKLFEENNIITVQIPANCSDKLLQPMDVSINKPMKEELKAEFQAWYASEVKKQLKEASVEQMCHC